eukprot:TRINITY_DN28791_c0_g1_i1.p1 TRINITY_DN28791_c0_g1~~TRINITY_DN28791_c0_g1_i1.p1  ORF type:complete len:541 (+),score=82.88 TRINITY_DN28791_c0_g1_i1:90-1625(+)
MAVLLLLGLALLMAAGSGAAASREPPVYALNHSTAFNGALREHLALVAGVAPTPKGTGNKPDKDGGGGGQPSPPPPIVDLWVRAYTKHIDRLYNYLLPSVVLFWPRAYGSGLTVVLDAEDPQSARLGERLARHPPYPRVRIEPLPRSVRWPPYTTVGYSRQQYSTFWADRYSQAEFVGIVDADAAFNTLVAPEDLFEGGKPRLIGYLGEKGPFWDKTVVAATERAVGHPHVACFMANFPVVIRRSHFQLIRDHISRVLGVATFDAAFNVFAQQSFSQFNIMLHALWYIARDQYTWHFQIGPPWSKIQLPLPIPAEQNSIIARVCQHARYPRLDGPQFANLLVEGYCHSSSYDYPFCHQYRHQSQQVLLTFDGIPWLPPSAGREHVWTADGGQKFVRVEGHAWEERDAGGRALYKFAQCEHVKRQQLIVYDSKRSIYVRITPSEMGFVALAGGENWKTAWRDAKFQHLYTGSWADNEMHPAVTRHYEWVRAMNYHWPPEAKLLAAALQPIPA